MAIIQMKGFERGDLDEPRPPAPAQPDNRKALDCAVLVKAEAECPTCGAKFGQDVIATVETRVVMWCVRCGKGFTLEIARFDEKQRI
jgi:hypothetical protein